MNELDKLYNKVPKELSRVKNYYVDSQSMINGMCEALFLTDEELEERLQRKNNTMLEQALNKIVAERDIRPTVVVSLAVRLADLMRKMERQKQIHSHQVRQDELEDVDPDLIAKLQQNR